MLTANNTSYFVVASSLKASAGETQLPDSVHRGTGLLIGNVDGQHPPSLSGPGRAASTALPTLLPQSTVQLKL